MKYLGREAVQLENDQIRVTALKEGGHIAEILHKESGINPLWTPPWTTIEPSLYDRQKHPEYGTGVEAKLLAGIMGHNACVDLFGGPSKDEAEAGISAHGEASVLPYECAVNDGSLQMSVVMPAAQLRFTRTIELPNEGTTIQIAETVENLSATDRPIAWTQHVTLGPPFLKRGVMQFRASATRSRVGGNPQDFRDCMLAFDAEFQWPNVLLQDGTQADMQIFTAAEHSSAFTTHLMDPQQEKAYFTAYCPESKILFGYQWKQSDFPWLGIWEENCSRQSPPWNGRAITRGMEFGVSPFPETRRAMIERGWLFDTPTYKWVPAKKQLSVSYSVFIERADTPTFD